MQVDVKGLSYQEIEQIADHYSRIYGLKVWKGVGLEIQGNKHFLKKGSNDVIFVGNYNKRLPVESGKEFMEQVFGMKNWVKITEPSDIKKYPVGTPVRVNGVETFIDSFFNSNNGFEVEDKFVDRQRNMSHVFDIYDWEDPDSSVEVLVETPVPDTPVPDVPVEQDMVKNPNHYQLLPEHGLEVKDVLKALLNKIEQSDFDMNLYEAGWYQQSMQYFLRFCDKNGVQDLEKGVQTMGFVLESIKERTQED